MLKTSYLTGYAQSSDNYSNQFYSNQASFISSPKVKSSNVAFASAGYIWGNNNKTIVLEKTAGKKHDIDLMLEYISEVNKIDTSESSKLDRLIKKFLEQTVISNAEIKTLNTALKINKDSSPESKKNQIIEYILKVLALNKPVDITVGPKLYHQTMDQFKQLGLIVYEKDHENGVFTIQKKCNLNNLNIPKGSEAIWLDILVAEMSQDVDQNRAEAIKNILSDPENLNAETLNLINGWLKAINIGIAPGEVKSLPADTKNVLMESFVKLADEDKSRLLSDVKKLCVELPSKGKYTKVPNRGPVRFGILGFKDNIIHGDNEKWIERLGDAGHFPRAIHQLAHQIPAPELGYICKAYAIYLRTNGDMNAFDKYLADNKVSFEDYFVENAKSIASNNPNKTYCQILPDKPKGVITNVSDGEIRAAFEKDGWTGQNVDELMSRNDNKVALFFDVYGDVILNTMKGMGIGLSNGSAKDKLPEAFAKKLDNVDQLTNKANESHRTEDWLQLLEVITALREELLKETSKISDPEKLLAVVDVDNNMEALVNATIASNILSKASKGEGLLYHLNDQTEQLLINLIDNYKLSNQNIDPLELEEFNLLSDQLKEAFKAPDKGSKDWAEKLLVPLSRLQRLIASVSNDISDVYKPVAVNMAKIHSNTIDKAEVINQLADGLIRGDILFPVSQITTGARSQVRKTAGASPWQAISSGEVLGQVVHAESMDQLQHIVKDKKQAGQNVDSLVCFVDYLIGAEEPPEGVKAIITPKVIDTLAHLGVRCRQEDIVFACLDDKNQYNDLLKDYNKDNSFVKLNVSDSNVKIDSVSEADVRKSTQKKAQKEQVKVVLPEADREFKTPILKIDEIKLNKSGPKAYNISKLATTVPVPESTSVPFSVFDKVLNDPINSKIKQRYDKNLAIIAKKEETHDLSVVKELAAQRKLVESLKFPADIIKTIEQTVKSVVPEDTQYLITRSSTNGEDLKDFSGAGLYESFPGATKEKLDLFIKKVWASKWGKRAYDARVKASIPHKDLAVAVLVQPCIDAKYAFVTHTTNPLTHNPDEVYIDLVQGLGEALVSGEIPGTGYGYTYNKKTGEVKRLHLADKSYKLVPDGQGGLKKALADYREDAFAGDKAQWEDTIKQIGQHSVNIEKLYEGKPQDIEGVIKASNDKIYIVQTRDQLGIKNAKPAVSFASLKLSLPGLNKNNINKKPGLNLFI